MSFQRDLSMSFQRDLSLSFQHDFSWNQCSLDASLKHAGMTLQIPCHSSVILAGIQCSLVASLKHAGMTL
jgi:hypothetical protein